MAGLNKDTSLIQGLIITVVGDQGPELIANISPISDDNALITALHLVSLSGLEEDSENEDASKIIGPLPVKGTADLKSLYYSEYLIASNAVDARLIEHGAKVGIVLLFQIDKLPEIRRAAGLIEPYLKIHLSKISETSELTKQFAVKLRDHIVDLISRPRLRTFWIQDNKAYEYKDPLFIRKKDDVIIIDEENKKMYLITEKNTGPFTKRVIRKTIDELNFDLYRGGFQIINLESFDEIEKLLIKHNIQVT